MSKKAVRKACRSGNEKCLICESQCRLVEHHINGRDIHNWDRPSNVSWICPNCHDLVHAGDIVIEGWFMTTKGRELLFHRNGEKSLTGFTSSPPIY